MNQHNETMRILKHSISQYERMSMLATRSSDKWMYKRKADKCRDILNQMLSEVKE